MTDEQKVGQLFVNLFHFGADTFSGNELTNEQILAAVPHRGRALPGRHSPSEVQALLNELQTHASSRC